VKIVPWIPYAVAAGLLVFCATQEMQIMKLTAGRTMAQKLVLAANDKIARLEASNALISLRLVTLEAKDPAYANARVFVAWDATDHRGSIALDNLPPTPAGHDYQLWVLDPNAPGPVSAGVLRVARTFEVASCSMPRPGFAITLEPVGGSAALTGPILFAVAPAE
jgi:anti-sigma-K factor RskA